MSAKKERNGGGTGEEEEEEENGEEEEEEEEENEENFYRKFGAIGGKLRESRRVRGRCLTMVFMAIIPKLSLLFFNSLLFRRVFF